MSRDALTPLRRWPKYLLCKGKRVKSDALFRWLNFCHLATQEKKKSRREREKKKIESISIINPSLLTRLRIKYSLLLHHSPNKQFRGERKWKTTIQEHHFSTFSTVPKKAVSQKNNPTWMFSSRIKSTSIKRIAFFVT